VPVWCFSQAAGVIHLVLEYDCASLRVQRLEKKLAAHEDFNETS